MHCWVWWLTPVISATLEDRRSRLALAKSLRLPISIKSWMWCAHTCHPSYAGSRNRISVQAWPQRKWEALFEIYFRAKRARGMTWVTLPAWQAQRPRFILPVLSQKKKSNQALLAHTYNPSYLGGWEQDNDGLRLAWTKKSVRLHVNQ
jgi:hypothetical protein